jgi:uncharacterized membrane protein YgdD (TMEM256/DUF423 family)
MALGVLGGLMGATGVALAAVAAHVSGDATLKTAADFLLFHAAALLATLALGRGRRGPTLAGSLVAGSLLGLGAVLFSGDLAIRSLTGLRLVPMAAPTGGMLLIAGWLAVAITAPLARRRDG